MSTEKRFTLPKGPTIAGTAVIAFLIGAIIFGYLGYYVTKNFIFPCPVCVSEQCTECEKCEVCEYAKQNEGCVAQPIKEESSEVDTPTETYKYVYTVEVTSYEPNPNKYLGFRYCNDDTCIVHGVELDRIAKATMGEKFVIKYNDENIVKDGAAAGTRYIDLRGDFYLMPV